MAEENEAAGPDGEREVDPAEQRRLRLKAKSRRVIRALRLLLYSVVLGLSFPALIWFMVYTNDIGQSGKASSLVEYILLLAPVCVMIGCVAYTAYFYFTRKYVWPRYSAEAKLFVDTHQCVEGFIALFRTYVGTRQVRTYSYLWSAWGFCAGTMLLLIVRAGHGFGEVRLAAVVALFGLATLNFWLAMLVSNNFLVGTVVVDSLSEMSYRATNPAYQNADALHETRAIRNALRRKYYWWFYW